MIKLRVEQVILETQAKWGKNITYRDIQESTGIALSTLSRIRSGASKRVDLDVMNSLANYLGCHPCDFFEYVPDEPAEDTPETEVD